MLQNIALLSEKHAERERYEQDLKNMRCCTAQVGEMLRWTRAPCLPPLCRISPKHSESPLETPSSNRIFSLCAIPPLLLST